MVKYSSETLTKTFAALADPTRRAMLERLSRGPLPVTALAEPFHVSLPAISKQLRVLEQAGLVVQEKDGRIRLCHLQTGPMERAALWIEQYRRFWDGQLESLASYMEDADPEEHPPGSASGNHHQEPEETNTP